MRETWTHPAGRAVLAVAAAALCVAALGQSRADQPRPPLEPGTPAPAFTTRTLDGHTLTLAALRGRVVMLDFWATWCGPCRMSTPTLVSLQHKFGPDGLKIVGMSIDGADSRADIPGFIKDMGVTYTVTYAPDANVATAMAYHDDMDPNTGETFDHPIPPCVFLIDRHGRVRWSQIGYSNDEQQILTPLIRKLLAER
ncbi:MAG: TlpA family protein disulfide reductase [Capsulimonadaceae bacterium]